MKLSATTTEWILVKVNRRLIAKGEDIQSPDVDYIVIRFNAYYRAQFRQQNQRACTLRDNEGVYAMAFCECAAAWLTFQQEGIALAIN